MGTCYTVILIDEYCWDYVGLNQEKVKNKLASSLNKGLEESGESGISFDFRECNEPGMMIIDLDKNCPEYEPLRSFLLHNADAVYFRTGLNSTLKKLE